MTELLRFRKRRARTIRVKYHVSLLCVLFHLAATPLRLDIDRIVIDHIIVVIRRTGIIGGTSVAVISVIYARGVLFLITLSCRLMLEKLTLTTDCFCVNLALFTTVATNFAQFSLFKALILIELVVVVRARADPICYRFSRAHRLYWGLLPLARQELLAFIGSLMLQMQLLLRLRVHVLDELWNRLSTLGQLPNDAIILPFPHLL